MLASIFSFVIGLFYTAVYITSPLAPDFVSPTVIVESTNGWHGSGVFIAPNKVLTVKHVADDVTKLDEDTLQRPVITIRTSNGNIFHEVGYVESDELDVAIITVDHNYTGPLPKVSCEGVKRGQELVVVGNPGSDEFVQEVIYNTGGQPGWHAVPETLQMFKGVHLFEGPAIGGFSGSPIYTLWGDVVGLLDLSEADSDGRTGLGGYLGIKDACEFVTSQA